MLLNSTLIAIGRVLTKHRKRLDSEHTQAAFGALYENLNVEYVRKPRLLVSSAKEVRGGKRPALGTLCYPLVYLVRRTAFVAVTFLLFNQPSLQLYLMIHSSLLYIFYICTFPLYRTRALRRHELANEMILLLIYYHLALLSNVAWDLRIK